MRVRNNSGRRDLFFSRFLVDLPLSPLKYSGLQSKGFMDDARLKVRTKAYLADATFQLQRAGGPALTTLMKEEIELAYENGYKAGVVDATRRETPENNATRLN